jgi:hypothetical protein
MVTIFQLNSYQDNKRLDQSEAVDQLKTVITGEFDVSCTITGNFSQTNFNITIVAFYYLLLLYPRCTKGEGVYCFTSVRPSVLPSVQDIFRRIFLSN